MGARCRKENKEPILAAMLHAAKGLRSGRHPFGCCVLDRGLRVCCVTRAWERRLAKGWPTC